MRDINKCNEDLKELENIIQSVQFAKRIGRSTAKGDGEDDDHGEYNIAKDDQPSPVSVLDNELARSPLISTSYIGRGITTHG